MLIDQLLFSIVEDVLIMILVRSFLFLKVMFVVSIIIGLFIEFVCLMVNINSSEGFVGIQLFVFEIEDEENVFFCEVIEFRFVVVYRWGQEKGSEWRK